MATQLFKPGNSAAVGAGRPPGSKNKTRLVAEALMGYNGNKVVKEILRKALDPTDKDQAMMLKCCLERILPPVREMTVKHEKNTSISVIVEGIQQYISEVVDAEIVEEMDQEELDVAGALSEDAYAAIEAPDEVVASYSQEELQLEQVLREDVVNMEAKATYEEDQKDTL